jgi:hypothetical protein
MTSASHQHFVEIIAQLEQHYAKTDHQLNSLRESVRTTDWNESLAMNVIEQLGELRAFGEQVNVAFAALDTNDQQSAQVQGGIKKVADQIQSLLGIIGELENSAKHSRDQLLPEINASVRAFQMHKAYSAQAIS